MKVERLRFKNPPDPDQMKDQPEADQDLDPDHGLKQPNQITGIQVAEKAHLLTYEKSVIETP